MSGLREAGPADAEAIAAVETAALAAPWSRADVDAQLAAAGARAWVWTGAATTGAPDRVAGFVLFRRVLDEAELLRLGVRAEARRAGIGGRLLTTALRALAADGVRHVHLEVAAGNEPARRLYERCGLTVVGRRAAYYRDGDDALVMHLELAP